MPENGSKNIFREKQRNKKVSLMFFDVKVLTEWLEFHFLILSTKKQGTLLYLAFQNLKTSSKNGHQFLER